MLRRFRIVNGSSDKYAVLEYDTETEEYTLHIPKDVPATALPAIPAAMQSLGMVDVGHEKTLIFVRERVVPPDRQNIGTIMREIGMKYYDEFPLLMWNMGRSARDDFWLEEISETL